MSKKKMTVLDFQKYKEEGRRFSYTTAYDYTMANIVNESSVEVMLCGDSLGMIVKGTSGTVGVTMDEMIFHTRNVVRGAPDTFIVGDLPFGSYQVSDEQAVENACRLMMESSCDCVKLEGGKEVCSRIRAIVQAGVPVMGHIGLTPQSASSLGGFKCQGVTPEGAQALIEDAKALEAAGVFSIVVECVPVGVGKALQEAVRIPILGAGAGPYVACQWLNFYDMLGIFGEFKPKFCKQYRQLRADIVSALDEFHAETLSGAFPSQEFCYNKVVPGYEP